VKKLLATLFLVLLAVGSAAGGERGASSLKPVERKGKWGFTDPDGKMVISPKFYRALGFSEGLAPVATGHRVVLIDRTGKVVKRSPGGKSPIK